MLVNEMSWGRVHPPADSCQCALRLSWLALCCGCLAEGPAGWRSTFWVFTLYLLYIKGAWNSCFLWTSIRTGNKCFLLMFLGLHHLMHELSPPSTSPLFFFFFTIGLSAGHAPEAVLLHPDVQTRDSCLLFTDRMLCSISIFTLMLRWALLHNSMA